MARVSTDALPEPTTESTRRVREALTAAGFTADGLLDLLGAPAYAALAAVRPFRRCAPPGPGVRSRR